jgi:hypothetical protein
MPPSNIFSIGALVEKDASKTGYIITREATGTNSDRRAHPLQPTSAVTNNKC